MFQIVGSPPDNLPLEDWKPLFELAVGHGPDLILELGRGYGNSTCVFTLAANELGCRVVSLGIEGKLIWEKKTTRDLTKRFGGAWLERLDALQADITETDYRPILEGAKRVFVYWDAHDDEDNDVSGTVINTLIPLLPPGSMVVVDDIWAAGRDLPDVKYWAGQFPYLAWPFQGSFPEVEALWAYLGPRLDVAWTQHTRRVSFSV
jgi:cephalosporin hydroxylase